MEFRTGSLGGVVTMSLFWALVWAAPGMAIEAIDNIATGAHWFTRQIDMWPQTLGLPGFIGGVVFSVLLLVTEGRRGFAELPLARSGASGAVSGLLVGVLVVWVMDTGLSDPWQLGAVLLGVGALLGAVCGVGSPLVFRYAAQRRASVFTREG